MCPKCYSKNTEKSEGYWGLSFFHQTKTYYKCKDCGCEF